ncbi:MAG TPA: hypothetical protein PJ988_08930 [Anaerolinea sp.]|mgnify:FL=1|nr:hypothetical protein [Anaerolinea sp.]
MTTTNQRFYAFAALGAQGRREDVDVLMQALAEARDLATTKLVDYGLSLVETREGKAHLRHYLFHGTQAQRNFAALYFKRRGRVDVLEEALALGLIDREQAFSK